MTSMVRSRHQLSILSCPSDDWMAMIGDPSLHGFRIRTKLWGAVPAGQHLQKHSVDKVTLKACGVYGASQHGADMKTTMKICKLWSEFRVMYYKP